MTEFFHARQSGRAASLDWAGNHLPSRLWPSDDIKALRVESLRVIQLFLRRTTGFDGWSSRRPSKQIAPADQPRQLADADVGSNTDIHDAWFIVCSIRKTAASGKIVRVEKLAALIRGTPHYKLRRMFNTGIVRLAQQSPGSTCDLWRLN